MKRSESEDVYYCYFLGEQQWLFFLRRAPQAQTDVDLITRKDHRLMPQYPHPSFDFCSFSYPIKVTSIEMFAIVLFSDPQSRSLICAEKMYLRIIINLHFRLNSDSKKNKLWCKYQKALQCAPDDIRLK